MEIIISAPPNPSSGRLGERVAAIQTGITEGDRVLATSLPVSSSTADEPTDPAE